VRHRPDPLRPADHNLQGHEMSRLHVPLSWFWGPGGASLIAIA
jgi:hypothetical protein